MKSHDACPDTDCPEDSGLAYMLCMVGGWDPSQSDTRAVESR